MEKRNAGVTLIALVITIIVLLILAGIVISLTIGENGMINKASEAGKEYELASIKEQIQMDILGKVDNDVSVSYDDIEEILEKYAGENGKVIYEDDEKTIPIGVNPNKYPDDTIWLADIWNGNIGAIELVADGSFDGTVNTPKLVKGMTQVAWDNVNKEFKPTTNKDWYNYDLNEGSFTQDDNTNRQAKWANATTQNGSYFVWIPRYAYKIISGENESGTQINSANPTLGSGEIDIMFLQGNTDKDKDGNTIPTDYMIHPAFDFDGPKEGIWVGKYESSTENGQTGTNGDKVKIVPNVLSWKSINISTMYNKARNMASENNLSDVDTHMIKNSEWGCVAYLAHSKYGRNGVEVTINNHSGYKTGFAGGIITASSGNLEGTNTFLYNTPKGMLASTTGNITGIYDMSGGAWEYVMGGLKGTVGSSGFKTVPTDTKYYDSYQKNGTGSNRTLNYAQNSDKKGDAVFETSSNSASPWTLSWFGDYSYFPGLDNPWFLRRMWLQV